MTNCCLRLPPETIAAIFEFCKRERVNFSAFCREAIHAKLKHDELSNERLDSSLANINEDLNYLKAMLDRFVVVFFSCVPEPEEVDRERAMERRQKYLGSVHSTIEKGGRVNGHHQKKGAN